MLCTIINISLLLILCFLYKEMGLRNTEDDALDPNDEKDSGKGELLVQYWSYLT
jgi:hypothetical protein